MRERPLFSHRLWKRSVSFGSEILTAMNEPSPWPNRAVFLLSSVGLLVAGYLWFLHATSGDVPCGGSHDCATVAESPYARFPVGSGPWVAMYGTFGYVTLIGLSLARTFAEDPKRDRQFLTFATLGAAAGTLFSLYLTFVEATILHAWCKWCLTSQVIIALVFLITGAEWLRSRNAPLISESSPLEERIA